MPDRAGKARADVAFVASIEDVRCRDGDQSLLVGALVEFRVLEGQREGSQRRSPMRCAVSA
jgi:hypothetical protein